MAELNFETVIKAGVEKALKKPIVDGKSITQWAAIGMKAPRWVSVKDRLPEDGQQVVVIAVNGFREVVNFEERTGRWLGMEGWYPTDRIAHWMPLPTPPEEVSKLNEITEEVVSEVMKLRAAGTCAWCGGHNRELLVNTWQIGGELRIGWVCEKCLEEVSGDG